MKIKYYKHPVSFFAQAVLLLFAFLAISLSQADEMMGDTEAPYMELASKGAEFPLLSTEVKAEIIDGIVRARVTQVYMNRGKEPIEAVYLFPLSTQAAVHGMKMKIGERVVIANIEEKKAAQKIYEEAKAQKKVASLLEQKRPNVFQTKVANILPGDVVEVEIEYTEFLLPDNLIYEWIFPTVVGPRYASGSGAGDDKWVENPYFKTKTSKDLEQYTAFSLDAVVKSSVDFKGFQCRSHDPKIEYKGKREVRISLDSRQAGYQADREFVVKYKLAEDKIITGLMAHQGEKENFFLVNVQPPARVKPEHIPNREYIFVIDVSGSMHGFPLDTTKELFKSLSYTMKSTDRFNILFFAGGSKLLAPESLPATAGNINLALNMMNSHDGSGGTNLTQALKDALALNSNRDRDLARSFVVITDGYISAEKETFELIRESRNQANIFCFGIGSSVNRHLIEGIAKVGGGEPFIVTSPQKAAKEAEFFRKYIDSPVLTNISLEAKGIELMEIQPGSINDLFANRTLAISGKWKGAEVGSLTITGKTGSGETFKQEFTLDPNEVHDNPVLEDLWARQTVRELVDFNSVAEDADLRGRITNLGLKYSIVTPFTSFVAVDHTPQEMGEDAKTVTQPLPLPANVYMSSTGNVISNGSIPEPSSVLLFALSIVAALSIRNRK